MTAASRLVTVDVLLFAGVREAMGLSQTRLSIAAPASAKDLLDRLCELHPELVSHRPTLRLAINQEYANLEHSLSDGDEVALIPPVCGG